MTNIPIAQPAFFGDVLSSKPHEKILSIDQPAACNAVYNHTVILNMVPFEGKKFEKVLNNVTEQADLQAEIVKQSDTLAWVDILTKAVVKLHHDRELQVVNTLFGQCANDQPDSILESKPFSSLPTQYVVDKTEDGLLFMTKDEIIAEGELRPMMQTWLGRLANGRQMYSIKTYEFRREVFEKK